MLDQNSKIFDKSSVYVGRVTSTEDSADGGRVRVQIMPIDKGVELKKCPYAFPLMPKHLHIIPKEGESVIVVCERSGMRTGQRYYIGPIISQPQFINFGGIIQAMSLLKGGAAEEDVAPSTVKKEIGAFAKDEEIAIYGRKNSDIILSEDDIRIRCGVRLANESNKNEFVFNRLNPAYMKLKYYPIPLQTDKDKDVKSVTALVGDKLLLLSHKGSPYFELNDKDEGISDEDMKGLLNECHMLPYGDKLAKFLSLLVKMFKAHTHKYHNLPPTEEVTMKVFDNTYGLSEKDYEEKLLSQNILIN